MSAERRSVLSLRRRIRSFQKVGRGLRIIDKMPSIRI
jgi:hypothetical protein